MTWDIAVRLLFVCIAAHHMSEEELGDTLEEYTTRKRTRLWLLRQMFSTIPRSRLRLRIEEKDPEMLSSLSQDLRYVLRTLRRSPGFAAAAIAPIALGIGINTGVFSILNNVMYRPLPAPEPSELLSIYQDFRGVQKRIADTSIAQVHAELTLVANQIDRQQPGRSTALLIAPATSLSLPVARRDFASVAVMVVAAFGFILLIACANVANVLLARGEARSREIAVRLAMGAKRGLLVRLLLTESAVIALIGGVAGTLLAWWTFQAILPSMLSAVPRMSQPRLDANPNLTALWFGLAITVATAMLCGIVPALRASRQERYGAMKQDRAQMKARPGGWLRGALISIQVAACMVLLVSSALLLRALQATYSLDPGFEYQNVAVVSVDLRGPRYSDATAEVFRTQLIEQLASLPGVRAVAQVSKVPLSPGRSQGTFRLPAQEQTHEFDVNAALRERRRGHVPRRAELMPSDHS